MSSLPAIITQLIESSKFYIQNQEFFEGYKEKAKSCLKEIENVIFTNSKLVPQNLPPDIFVSFAEVALNCENMENKANDAIQIYFLTDPCKNQFFVRGKFCSALINSRAVTNESLKAEKAIEKLNESLEYVREALEIIIQNKQKYQFLAYNASITTWKIIRPYIKNQWAQNFTEIIDKISNILEETDDQDIDWRVRFMSFLAFSLFDAEKKPEGLKILDKLSDLIRKNGNVSYMENILRLRIHANRENAAAAANVKKDCDSMPSNTEMKFMFPLQQIRSGMIQDANIEKEITTIYQSLCPSILNYHLEKITSEEIVGSDLSPAAQDRISEAGRIAVKYGFLKLAEGSCIAIQRAKQSSLRAKIWNEYTRADLMLKSERKDINPKTGMRLNMVERQMVDLGVRIDILKHMERIMVANKRLSDPEIIIEGCSLIWNTSIPLLKGSTRKHCYKAFVTASQFLEMIESNDSLLRCQLYIELAKHEICEDYLTKAEQNLKKAMLIDYSTTQKKLKISLNELDDSGEYQRLFEKFLKRLVEIVNLKVNPYADTSGIIQKLIVNVENACVSKNKSMKESVLEKSFRELKDYEEPEFYVDASKKLTKEEIDKLELEFKRNQLDDRKKETLLCSKIAKEAYAINLFELAIEAGIHSLKYSWEEEKDPDLSISQAEANLVIAESHVELLVENNIEIGYSDIVFINSEDQQRELTEDQKKKFNDWKQIIIDNIIKSVKVAYNQNQSWLLNNSAIAFWNAFLPVIRDPEFPTKIIPSSKDGFKEIFEAMNEMLKKGSFDCINPDYNLSTKVNIYAYLAFNYALLIEKTDPSGACKICDEALLKQLPILLKKLFDSLKAKITKSVSSAPKAGGASKAPAKSAKSSKAEAAQVLTKGPQIIGEVLSYIEIANSSKDKSGADIIKKGVDTLKTWELSIVDEDDLEMSAELWCKLARLALGCTPPITDLAIEASQKATMAGNDKIDTSKAPPNRQRWYSLSKALLGEAVASTAKAKGKTKEEEQKIIFESLEEFVASAKMGAASGLGYLVLETVKQMWNTLIPLLDSLQCRAKLIKPLSKVAKQLYAIKESSDPDFLSLFYSAFFTCMIEEKLWKKGEKLVNQAFEFVPKTHHRVLWEAKMVFESKLGKNVLLAISNIKESTPSLQAKLWVKMARASTNPSEQLGAYQKAIEILKKDESVEVIEYIIELSEWLFRHKYPRKTIEDEITLAMDMILELDEAAEEEEEQNEGKGDTSSKASSAARTKLSRFSKLSKKTKETKISKTRRKGGEPSVTSKRSRTSKASSNRLSKRPSSKKSNLKFSKRGEEESQPLYLTASHFDKMFRMQIILALIAEDSQSQIKHMLKSISWLQRLWDCTYKIYTINKFINERKDELTKIGYDINNPDEERLLFFEILNNSDMTIPSQYNIPKNENEWLDYQIPTEVVEYCKSYDKPNLFSKWSFSRSTASYHYFISLLNLLENYGLYLHMIIVLKTLSAYSTVVLNNQYLEKVIELYRMRIMQCLGTKFEENILPELIESLKVDEETKAKEMDDIVSAVGTSSSDDAFTNLVEEDLKLVEKVRGYETWILCGSELTKLQKYEEAIELFDESEKHCKLLKDRDLFTQIQYWRSYIIGIKDPLKGVFNDIEVQKTALDLNQIVNSVILCSSHLKKIDRIEECRDMLQKTLRKIDSINSSISNGVTKPFSLIINEQLIILELAIVKIEEATEAVIASRKNKIIRESFNDYKSFEIKAQAIGTNLLCIKRAREYLELLLIFTDKFVRGDKIYVRKRKVEMWSMKLEKYLKEIINSTIHDKWILRKYVHPLNIELNEIIKTRIKASQAENLILPPKPPEPEIKEEEGENEVVNSK